MIYANWPTSQKKVCVVVNLCAKTLRFDHLLVHGHVLCILNLSFPLSLQRHIYGHQGKNVQIFADDSSLAVNPAYVRSWLDLLSQTPRVAPFLSKNDPFVMALKKVYLLFLSLISSFMFFVSFFKMMIYTWKMVLVFLSVEFRLKESKWRKLKYYMVFKIQGLSNVLDKCLFNWNFMR